MLQQCKQCRNEKRCTGSCYHISNVCQNQQPILSENCKNCYKLDCGVDEVTGLCGGGIKIEKVYNVYFITDTEISVLYYGQDTSANFGVQYGVRQLPKNLIVCQIKNINTYFLNNTNIECTDCELFIRGKWKAWSTKRQYIDDAITFYKNNNFNNWLAVNLNRHKNLKER